MKKRWLKRWLRLTYVDEAIISHTFRTRNENVFEAASQGVVLYCHAWKGLLKNAVALTLLGYAFTVAATVVFLIPLGVVAMMAPHSWELFRLFMFGLAVVLGTVAKWIVFDPLACTAAVLTFLRETEGVEADKAWEEKIAGVSDKFRELKEKAAAKMREMGKPAADATVPSEAVATGAATGEGGQG